MLHRGVSVAWLSLDASDNDPTRFWRYVLAAFGAVSDAVDADERAQAEPIATLARKLYPSATVTICRDAGGYDRVVRVSLDANG